MALLFAITWPPEVLLIPAPKSAELLDKMLVAIFTRPHSRLAMPPPSRAAFSNSVLMTMRSTLEFVMAPPSPSKPSPAVFADKVLFVIVTVPLVEIVATKGSQRLAK
jgi:hypothetical protein